MKKIYPVLLLALCTAYAKQACSQCVSCTITISGNDNASHVVPAGVNLCITESGTATGYISVTGGSLCNDGNILTSNVLISGGGSFTNNGNADVDSLLITGANTEFYNNGIVINERLAVTDGAQSINWGTITADYLGDSIGTFRNDGNMYVYYDFGNGYSSNFSNNGFLRVDRDFYNSFSSVFATECMIAVARDWYNSATVYGASFSQCGGFNVAGLTLNSGTIGDAVNPIDICDAGHPVNGVDANTGIITASTSYCVCTHVCAAVGIEELQDKNDFIVSPNPSAGLFTIQALHGANKAEIYNTLGTLVFSETMDFRSLYSGKQIDASGFLPGLYFIRVSSDAGSRTKKIIIE